MNAVNTLLNDNVFTVKKAPKTDLEKYNYFISLIFFIVVNGNYFYR